MTKILTDTEIGEIEEEFKEIMSIQTINHRTLLRENVAESLDKVLEIIGSEMRFNANNS